VPNPALGPGATTATYAREVLARIGKAGTVNVPSSTATAENAGLTGTLGKGLLDLTPLGQLPSIFNVSGWQDLAERAALILLGAVLLLVGVVLLTKGTGAGKSAITAAQNGNPPKRAAALEAAEA
jgi:hypothetical protein